MSRLRSLAYLAGQLARREVAARYRGSWLGSVWVVLTPLLMLTVYTWVFSEVFKARWGDAAPGDKTAFALNVFIGMLFLQFFSECISRAPSLMLSNANYVKKVVFPLPLLAVVSLLVAGFNWLVGVGIWAVFYAVVHHQLPVTLWILPLCILPLAAITLGLSWVLAAFGTYLRDIGPAIQVMLGMLTFVSPVFFPSSALPGWLATVMQWNPLTLPIETARNVLMLSQTPVLLPWLLYIGIAGVVLTGGLACFRWLRAGFADVL